MKYIKTYHERLGDKLVAPNEDEILNKIKYLSEEDIITQSLDNNYLIGLKYVFNQNNYRMSNFKLRTLYMETINRILEYYPNISIEIVNYLLNMNNLKYNLDRDIIYLLEKYILKKHENVEKSWEKSFIEYISNLEEKIGKAPKEKPLIEYTKDDFIIFINFEQSNLVLINYDKIINDLKNGLFYKINKFFITKIIQNKFKFDENTTFDEFIDTF